MARVCTLVVLFVLAAVADEVAISSTCTVTQVAGPGITWSNPAALEAFDYSAAVADNTGATNATTRELRCRGFFTASSLTTRAIISSVEVVLSRNMIETAAVLPLSPPEPVTVGVTTNQQPFAMPWTRSFSPVQDRVLFGPATFSVTELVDPAFGITISATVSPNSALVVYGASVTVNYTVVPDCAFDFTCPPLSVPNASAGVCTDSNCTAEQCCIFQPGVCLDYKCEGKKPLDDLNVTCASRFCTDEECCVIPVVVTGNTSTAASFIGAGCLAVFIFIGMFFGCFILKQTKAFNKKSLQHLDDHPPIIADSKKGDVELTSPSSNESNNVTANPAATPPPAANTADAKDSSGKDKDKDASAKPAGEAAPSTPSADAALVKS